MTKSSNISSLAQATEATIAALQAAYPKIPDQTIKAIEERMLANEMISDESLEVIKAVLLKHEAQPVDSNWLNQVDAFFLQESETGTSLIKENVRDFNQEISESGKVVRWVVRFLGQKKYKKNEINKMTMTNRDFLRASFINFLNIAEVIIPLKDIIELRNLSDYAYFRTQEMLHLKFSPRSVEDAEQAYQALLKLPKTGVYYDAYGKQHKTIQPLIAQYWLISLIKQSPFDNQKLHDWQIETLNNAPDWFFDFPKGGGGEVGTSRPAFWWSVYVVGDDELVKALKTKQNRPLQDNLERDLIEYKKRKAREEKLSVQSETQTPFDVSKFPQEQHDLVEALTNLEQVLKVKAPLLAKSIGNGNSPEKITQLNKLLAPLQLADDVKVLYRWFNGSNECLDLFDFPNVSALLEAYNNYEFNLEMGEGFLWSKAWFSLAYESNVHLLSPLTESPKKQSEIYYLDAAGGDIELHHESVLAMVKTTTEAYETGAKREINGETVIDDEQLKAIRLKYSPEAYVYDSQTETEKGISYEFYNVNSWKAVWQKYKIGDENI